MRAMLLKEVKPLDGHEPTNGVNAGVAGQYERMAGSPMWLVGRALRSQPYQCLERPSYSSHTTTRRHGDSPIPTIDKMVKPV